MDTEQILTQILIAFFTVIFFIFACRVKSNIEKKYRKASEKLKNLKEKVVEISVKETILCKQVLCEITNRHQRSIIAASLKQTLDEEMEKLEHIKDSIKLVQQIPDLKPSFQKFDRDFFPGFGGAPVFGLGSKEANGEKDENYLVKRKDSRLQTKLCNAWRAQSRRFPKNDNSTVKREKKKVLNDYKDRNINNDQFSQPSDKKIQAVRNFTVNNVSVVNFRDNHFQNTRGTLDKIVEAEPFENEDESVKTLPDLNNDVVETLQDEIQMFSLNNLSNLEEKRDGSNRYTKKRNIHSCPDNSSYFNNKTEKNNTDIPSESILFAPPMENKLFVEKAISCRKIHDTKNGNNRAFQFDFINSSGRELGVKIMIEQKNNKSVICCNGDKEENLKIVKIKMFQVSTKANANNKNTLERFVFKISLKINKKNVVLKCVISCLDKESRNYKRLDYSAKQQLPSNTNVCRVQSKHRSFNRKPQRKRHSLYTNTDLISAEREPSDNTYHSVPFAEGDITMAALEHQHAGPILCGTRKHGNYEGQDSERDRAILKQCVQLTNDCFKGCSQLFYADVPQLTNKLLQENEMLSTIEEEATDDGEEYVEKTKPNTCSSVELKKKDYLRNKEQRLVQTIRMKESEQHRPLFCEKSKLYEEKNKTQNEIQTTLNLKASQVLETINLVKLKENKNFMRNLSQTPTGLTCVFELRSYDETMYTQNIFMNRFFDGMLDNECSNIVQNIFQNRQLTSINNSTSCTIVNDKGQNLEIQAVEYEDPLNYVDRKTLKDVVLGETTPTNTLFVRETVFLNNESDELYFETENVPGTMLVMEGAVFSSADNSATELWDEN